jgi:hypothetical protein
MVELCAVNPVPITPTTGDKPRRANAVPSLNPIAACASIISQALVDITFPQKMLQTWLPTFATIAP